MAKAKTIFACTECGSQFPRWQGRCTECGNWNTIVEEVAERKSFGMALTAGAGGAPVALEKVTAGTAARFSSGIEELDRVLGGGLVKGSLVLVGGPPGIGKSTLLLQAALKLGKSSPPILYVSGEESPQQIRLRADRLCPGLEQSGIIILPETELESIEAKIAEINPSAVIVDSIQTVFRSDLSPAPGSVTQVRECAASLMRLAKNRGITIILVGHVTKGGEIAGPRVLEHLVDTVLHFDSYGIHNVRALNAVKNRFGTTREIGFFEMEAEGLRPIPDASKFFLETRVEGISGTVIFPSMEGTRPVLVEIQALVSKSYGAEQGAPPIRRSVGVDLNRLLMLAAVLQKRCSGLGLWKADIFVNAAGGMRLTEPALDLPLVLAIASSLFNKDMEGSAAFGEVGLGGEIRSVTNASMRLDELLKLGIKTCFVPARSSDEELQARFGEAGLRIVPCQTVSEALQKAGLRISSLRNKPSEDVF